MKGPDKAHISFSSEVCAKMSVLVAIITGFGNPPSPFELAMINESFRDTVLSSSPEEDCTWDSLRKIFLAHAKNCISKLETH